MVRVKIRELKNRLSYYLRLVRGGETVVILDRDRPIGEIRPRQSEAEGNAVAHYLEELELRGLLVKPTRESGPSATEIVALAKRRKERPDWRGAYAAEREDRFE